VEIVASDMKKYNFITSKSCLKVNKHRPRDAQSMVLKSRQLFETSSMLLLAG